jgi:hypothetical protein
LLHVNRGAADCLRLRFWGDPKDLCQLA